MALHSVTTTVYLLKRSQSGNRPATWCLKWAGHGGKQLTESLGRASRMTKAQAKKLRQQKEQDINEGRVPLDKGPGLTLAEFKGFYLRHRTRGDAPKVRRTTKRYAKLGDGTLRMHDMALRYLVEFFGPSCHLDSITTLDAEAWADALAAGDLASARSVNASRTGPLSENTLRTASRTVKAIFGWARSNGLIHANPFEDFIGTGIKAKPNPDVPLDDFRKLCEDAPQAWKAMFGLCRLAGLRRSEALSLPWDGTRIDHEGAEVPVGIDWDGKRIAVVGKGDRFRQVPICKELYGILLATFHEAEDGAERVVDPINDNNLEREMKRLLRAAGLKPWKKPYQSLRSSCENGWKVNPDIPEATYCAWIGHSLDVSRKHYVSPQDSEFEIVTG